MAILKPSPSAPREFSAGTTTSVSANAEVSVERWPILSRCFSIVTPGASIGTMNAEIPLWPFDGSVFANTTSTSVAGVRDERLRPVQDVLVAAADGGRLHARDVGAGVGLAQPERAEDRLFEQRRQPLRLLLVRPGQEHRAGAEAVGADRGPDAEQPQLSSSPTSIPSNADSPRPPSSSGTCRFISPSSCAFAITSAGWVERSSYSASLGRISLAANSRASSRRAFCSSVRAKETPSPRPHRSSPCRSVRFD